MKIAFVVPGFSADENDWCIPAHTDLVRALARSHEVHVYAMRYPHRKDTYRLGNAIVHSFNGVGSSGGASARLWLTVLKALAREHRIPKNRMPFDVIHAIFGSEAGCAAVLAGKWLHVPSVVWLVDGELVGIPEIGYGADLIPRQRWMNKLILQYADHILCGCEATSAAARERNPHVRVETLPLGVNLERFHPLSAALPSDGMLSPQNPLSGPGSASDARAPDQIRFVNVGSLLPVKSQTTLLEAFGILCRELPNAHLTIAGVGPLETTLRALASQQGIGERVTFAGNVPHDELPSLYSGAAVFVQSSRHEGQGMALLEAGACGCAMCGTNKGALADLARAGAAIAAEDDSPTALATAMEKAYQIHPTLGPHGRQMVEREYNLERICARLEHLYMRLKQGGKFSLEHDVAGA